MVCCALYVLLAMAAYGRFDSLGSGLTGKGSPDAVEQVWWLAWTAFALPHHSIFLTQWQNYPAGQNFGVNGSMLALGVLFMPITKLFGPIVAWNIALRFAIAVSASSMCFVLRRWTTWWPAAFVGGLLYGFSAYMAYSGSYLFLIFVPLPPVIFLLLHEILVRQQWRPGRTGAVLGAVCALQFFIGSEVLASTVVMGAVAAVLFLLVNRRQLVERRQYALTAFASSLGVGALLLIGPVVFTLAGPEGIRGPPTPAGTLNALFPSDLLGSIVPNSQWLSTSQLTAVANQRFAFASGLYLGLPLIVVLVSFAVFLRRRKTILFAGGLALIAFVLSLGPRLRVDGHETISLPFVIFEHLPLVNGFEPSRFSLYTAMFTAGMFAIGIDELRLRMMRSRRPRWLSPTRWRVATVGALVAICAVTVIPLAPRHTQPTTRTNIPSLFTSAAMMSIPAGSVVLAYPYPDSSLGGYFTHGILLDQAVANMPFKLIGGWGWFPSSTGSQGTTNPTSLKPKIVQEIFDAALQGDATTQMDPLSESNVAALRMFLRKYDVQTVIVSPIGTFPSAVISYVTAAIGSPVQSGGVTAWFHVKERLRSDEVHAAPVASGEGGESFRKLVTRILVPANGTKLSGSRVLLAATQGYFGVTKVEFYITGGSQHDTLIGTGRQGGYGWYTSWNTTTVANGTYQLRSVAYGPGEINGTSTNVSITVSN